RGARRYFHRAGRQGRHPRSHQFPGRRRPRPGLVARRQADRLLLRRVGRVEYQLHLRAQNGRGSVKKFALGDPPCFYYEPTWSPAGKKIAYTDMRLNVWILDLASGKSAKVDTNTYDERTLDPTWSPDSRWLAYTKIPQEPPECSLRLRRGEP